MVEMTYLAIIGIAMAAMFFGYGFGLFEGRGQGYKKRKTEEEQEQKGKPEPASSPTPVRVEVDDPGLMRIKNENGYLTLDLDGTRVDTSSLSSDQRKRLIEMLNFIRPWLENKPAPAPPTVTPPTPSQPVPLTESRQGTPIVSTPAAPQPIAQRIDTASPLSAASTAKSERPAAPANSIVGQIDSILQERLIGTPLEGRGIFLSQSPEGGVNVYVGLTRYNGVDDVPDAEIKAAIRDAISAWENKYTPGLK